MAGRQAKQAEETKTETVVLVSPDGEQQRTVTVGGPDEVKARWDGYLPQEQAKLEPTPVEVPAAPRTVGTNA